MHDDYRNINLNLDYQIPFFLILYIYKVSVKVY